MPAPTVPVREVLESDVYFWKKSSTVFGQLFDFQTNEDVPTNEHSGLSTKSLKRTFGAKRSGGTLQIYDQDTNEEAAALLGTDMPPTGWAGTESVKLDADMTPFNLTVEQYSSSGTLQWTITITNYRPTSLGRSYPAEGAVVRNITFVCDDITEVPAAGLGA